jgi:hypothetical protein
MKGLIIGLIVIVVLAAGGFAGYKYLLSQTKSTTDTSFKTESVKKTGIVQAAKGDDYQHVLMSEGKTIGVASYSIDLNKYLGKKIEVTGQYSGTTLYADSVVEVQ